jgi:hypothetical protein
LPIDLNGIEAIDFQSDLQFFNDHCKFIDSIIKKKQEDFKIRYKKKYVAENYDAEAYYLFECFPNIQWSAMFVAAHNIFEKNLNDICNYIRGVTGAALRYKDLKNDGIDRAKCYLSKVHNINDPFSKKEWMRITTLSKVRNILVHAAGELDLTDENHKRIFKLIEKERYLKIKSHDSEFQSAELFVDKQAVYDAILIYRKFLLSLLKNIKN